MTGTTTAGRGTARRRTGARLGAVVVAVVLLTLVSHGAHPAQARAAATCTGRLAKTLPFSAGELRIYKGRHYACAMTFAKKPGKRRYMRVSLQPRGGRAAVDAGWFTRYAGPITVHALNRCVRASGSVSGVTRSTGWLLC